MAIGATTITPVIIDVPLDGRAIVTVRNDSAREALYHISVFDWRVVDGADQFSPTQDFIASPPLFTLAPSGSQIVRLGYRDAVRPSVEQAYRLVLAEVPRPGDASNGGGVVDFAIQYLLPVFVAPTSHRTTPSLVWSLHTQDDAITLRADNLSTTRIALNQVGLISQPGAAPAPEFFNGQRVTVLAHAWRQWRFPLSGKTQSVPWRVVVKFSGNDAWVLVPDVDVQPATPR